MPPADLKPNFEADLERLEALAWQPAYSVDDLAKTLAKIYLSVAKANFSAYDVKVVGKAAPALMYRLFDVRTSLRARIPEWRLRGLLTHETMAQLRDCLRVLRYVTDMLGEIAIGNARLPAGATMRPAFTGSDRNTLINWPFYNGRDLPFRSGDVVMMRGHAHNSAAIARIGDVDSQFSHIGMIHIDDTGQHVMVESLIEDGAVVNTLAHAFSHGLVRAVLYRHKDATLAARAAQQIHDLVAASRKPLARRIFYDFSMRLDDRRRLFCSKLVHRAYALASNGAVKLPTYSTHIGLRNRDFLDRIGVRTDVTFSPGDIDVEPDFDLVAEWQDYRQTSNIRLQDFTMDKIFEWMDGYNYRFKETWLVWFVSIFGRLAARLSDDAKEMIVDVIPKIPINMRRRTIATVAMLHKTAEPIYHELQKLERECIAETGRHMHGDEIFAHLERIRAREGDKIGYLERSGI